MLNAGVVVVRGHDDESTWTMREPIEDVGRIVVYEHPRVRSALRSSGNVESHASTELFPHTLCLLRPSVAGTRWAFGQDLNLIADVDCNGIDVPPELELRQVEPPARLIPDEVHAPLQPWRSAAPQVLWERLLSW